jgi:hypothetical protein
VISNATRTTGNANGYNITSPTSFTAALAVGEGVQLANSTGVTYNTIQSIDSSNSMFVVPSTVPTGTLTIKKFYKEGTPVNFDGSGNTVYVDSSTSITVGIAFEPDTSGYALNAQIPQIRNTAQAIPKVVNKGAVVLLDCNSHWNGIKGPWNLGFPDVYQITNVHVGDINGIPYSDTNPDRLEWFTLSTNQKDDSYQISQLNIKPKYKNSLVNTSTMMVKFNVFTANITSSKSGFFSVDSYSIDDSDPDANSSAIATAQIPLYRDTTSATWDLRNYIDVRPMFANTANLVFGATYATTNPVNNNTTYLTGSSAGISIEPNSNFYYNVEYYLPREDKLILTKDGNVEPKMGTPSLTPKQPPINKTGIEVAEISVPPYPSLTFKESE